jgi:hypothetical protein
VDASLTFPIHKKALEFRTKKPIPKLTTRMSEPRQLRSRKPVVVPALVVGRGNASAKVRDSSATVCHVVKIFLQKGAVKAAQSTHNDRYGLTLGSENFHLNVFQCDRC